MRYKTLLVLILTIAILTTPVIANFTGEWGEYQDDPSNRGFIHDQTAHYTSTLGITYTNSLNGMNHQPLSANITGDADLETIIFSGNFLKMYDEEMILIDEINTGNALRGQPTLYDNGSTVFIIQPFHSGDNNYQGINITLYSYNGTSFLTHCTVGTQIGLSSGSDITNNPGIKCSNNFCYYVESITSANVERLRKINMTQNLSEDFCISYGGIINITPSASVDGNAIPAIADIDRDGKDEIVFVCDDDNSNNPGLCVFDSNGTGIPYLDTGFSSDGKLDNIAQSTTKISNPVLWNLDGAGDTEIIVTYTTGTDDLTIGAFISDGSSLFADTIVTATTVSIVKQPVIVDNGNSQSQWDVCSAGVPSATDDLLVLCTNNIGTTLTNFTITGFSGNSLDGIPIIAADIDTDGEDELVFSSGITETNGAIIVNTTSSNDYYVSVIDVNNDNEMEIIASTSGTTRIYYSNFTNNPPTIYNNLSFGGYGNNFGYSTPICINTTVTFTAQECGGTTSCNYDNDGSADQERIVGNCGQNADYTSSSSFTNNIANGTLARANPSFECFYNVTGIFNVRNYLEDEFNLGDRTQFNTETIVVNVINGESGVTCNIAEPVVPGETSPETDTGQEEQTNQAIDDTFGILFGTGSQSDALKLVVGLAIVISIIVMAAQNGITNGMALLGIGMLGVVLVTFIGLLTPAILLLIIMIFVLFMLFSRFIGAGSSSGGGG